MSWNERRLLRWLMAAALVAVPSAAVADVLVVRAIGPSAGSYRPGSKLPDSAAIELRAGDQVTVLDRGGTRTLRGPGRFTAAGAAATAAAPATRVAFNALTGAGGQRARVGAVRADDTPQPPRPDNIWFVDADKGGTVCLAQTPPVLWRASAQGRASATIEGGGAPANVAWKAGETALPWPGGKATDAGASYIVRVGGTAHEVRFERLDSVPADLMGLADALIAKGCTAQLDLLVTVAEPL